jgi:hypothetical protein
MGSPLWPLGTSSLGILKLRAGRVRRERMEAWVDAVSSPPAPRLHLMAVAAMMMMGLSMPPQGDDPEVAAALDMTSSYDQDLEDLRDELRPTLSERFFGWCKVANPLMHTINPGQHYRLLSYNFQCQVKPS